MNKAILLVFLLALIALSGCTAPPGPIGEQCTQSFCEGKERIACEGKWAVSGTYPNCKCDYKCNTQRLYCAGEGEQVPIQGLGEDEVPLGDLSGCCPGLDLIKPMEERERVEGYCTAECGNGVCGNVETTFNCPGDCTKSLEGMAIGFCEQPNASLVSICGKHIRVLTTTGTGDSMAFYRQGPGETLEIVADCHLVAHQDLTEQCRELIFSMECEEEMLC